MYKRMTICIIFFVLSLSICNASISNVGKATNEEKLVIQQAIKVNSSIYGNASALAWREFHDDFNYSSNILNDYVKKNITRTQAMMTTVSLYSLTTQTALSINSVTPPQKYSKYHNYTLGTVNNFRMYLFYLSKFLETNDPSYAVNARSYFNTTLNQQDLASQERILHLMI